jgi:hypothetical protein
VNSGKAANAENNWKEHDIVTRDEVRRWLVSRMKLARDMYGDRITDNALWLANKDYSAMRTAEKNKHDL